jgi:acetyl-CoA carboxylase carboxyl transferase subunit beta
MIGFVQDDVIATLQEQLPDNFQTAEYLLHHGLIDLTICRSFFLKVYLKHNSFYKHAPLKRAGYIPNKNEL